MDTQTHQETREKQLSDELQAPRIPPQVAAGLAEHGVNFLVSWMEAQGIEESAWRLVLDIHALVWYAQLAAENDGRLPAAVNGYIDEILAGTLTHLDALGWRL